MARIAINQTSVVSLLRTRAARCGSGVASICGWLSAATQDAGGLRRVDAHGCLRSRPGYPSALDAALDGAWLPRAVFEQLLVSWRAHLPVWHRYWRVRAQALGVDQLAGWDIDVPLVRSRRHIPYDEARRMLLEAMAPLGEEYVEVLRRGLYDERWVDWAVN
jgi:oligoendopeptidase F